MHDADVDKLKRSSVAAASLSAHVIGMLGRCLLIALPLGDGSCPAMLTRSAP